MFHFILISWLLLFYYFQKLNILFFLLDESCRLRLNSIEESLLKQRVANLCKLSKVRTGGFLRRSRDTIHCTLT
jgi:hypothetical protein